MPVVYFVAQQYHLGSECKHLQLCDQGSISEDFCHLTRCRPEKIIDYIRYTRQFLTVNIFHIFKFNL